MGFSNGTDRPSWKVAPVIDLVFCNEMDQIVAALALMSLDFHQGQSDCLGAHCSYSFKNMRSRLFYGKISTVCFAVKYDYKKV